MNWRCIVLCMSAVNAPLFAQMSAPDSKTVTKISEAAKICGFDDVGLKWQEKDASTIAIQIAPTEVQALSNPETAPLKFVRLRDCFFSWAYDRNVKVEMTIDEKAQ